MKLYLAGPLFTTAERAFNNGLGVAFGALGFDVWLPQDEEPRDKTAEAIFAKDVEGIDWADTVVACMDGPDPDSGTAWECGYAHAKGKRVVLYRTDFRNASDGLAPYNLMLAGSGATCLHLPMASVNEIADAVTATLRVY
jgi:nucleoside 2-deoxyribosyltransferase